MEPRTVDGTRDPRGARERKGRRLHQRAEAAADHDHEGPRHAQRGPACSRVRGDAACGKNHAAIRRRCSAASVPRLREPAVAARAVGSSRLEERDRRDSSHARRVREKTPMSTSTDLMTALAWSLLHFLWQGAAIAAFAAAAMQLFRASTTRYLIGILALALMCLSFGATFALLAGAPVAVGTEATADVPATSPDVAPAALPDGVVTLSFARPAEAWRDFAWVARVWLAGVCLLALRVAGGLLLLEHLRRRSLSPLPAELVERCLALQRRLRISRVVRYCECHLVTVPSVLGLFRPIVLLPMRALTGLSAEQLEVVIAHELGHIKRFDVAVNLFQVVAETLFFFHPAVCGLNRRIRADREDCCDDIAISACGRSAAYARALAIMADWRGTPELTLAATGGDVASRVARLLGISRQPTRVRSAGVLTAALVLAASLMAGAASIGIAQSELTTRFAPPSETVAQVDAPLAPAGPADPLPAVAVPAPAAVSIEIAPVSTTNVAPPIQM